MTLYPAGRMMALLIPILCVGCALAPSRPVEWPADLPPIAYFEAVYADDPHNKSVQTKEEYLTWVVRFYHGWDLYQDGWKSTTRDILLSVENPTHKRRIEHKLARLGKLISAEWAKQSDQRVIYSRELSIWGQALLKSMNIGEEEELIDEVTRDVRALHGLELDRTDINLKRYYAPDLEGTVSTGQS